MFSKRFLKNKIANFLLHLLFWVIVLLSYTYFFGYHTNNINYVFSFSLFLIPVTIGTTYTVTNILIPKYLITEKYLLFSLYCIYTIIASAFFIVMSFFYGLVFLSNINIENMAPMTQSPFFLFIAVYFIVFIASALNLARHNYKSRIINQELKNKMLKAQLKLKEQELNYLKMQIHPHFLFNTLNTLYGFALKKSEEAPEMIIKLSNILDYLLYQSDKPLVSLQEEIDHIKDYMALEKIRFSDVLNIQFQLENIKPTLQIAPMLLIPFVENSFKHGKIRDKKLSINISLKYTNDNIHFSIKNSCRLDNEIDEKGIGLVNIKKRLSLLYKDSQNLQITNDGRLYEVKLILQTNNSVFNEL